MILRSTAWDGPDPAPGDIVDLGDGQAATVESVAAGPGVGQWRLVVRPARLIRWST